MNNLYSKERLFIVALDHIPLGIMSGWEHAEETLRVIVEGKPDYIVANFGIIKRFSSLFRDGPGTILRLDGSPSYLVEDWRKASRWDLLYTVDDAVRLGASAVIVNIIVGGKVEMASICVATQIAGACLEKQVPLIISAIPAAEIAEHNTVEVAAFAARLASELGADVVNSYYDGDVTGLEYLVTICPAPVLLAGGATPKSDAETLRRAAFAIDAGCVGICFGRSIWQSKQPLRLMRALRLLLHQSQPLESVTINLNSTEATLLDDSDS
jgi:DhnA family fructose-bisphosphate aldolase class Ia